MTLKGWTLDTIIRETGVSVSGWGDSGYRRYLNAPPHNNPTGQKYETHGTCIRFFGEKSEGGPEPRGSCSTRISFINQLTASVFYRISGVPVAPDSAATVFQTSCETRTCVPFCLDAREAIGIRYTRPAGDQQPRSAHAWGAQIFGPKFVLEV